jgi:hypothetical protein
VFVEGGLVSFVTTYHKGYSFSKHVKTIHRYVPREVSELVVYFLALARPFVIDLQKMHGGVRGSSSFVWEPAPEQPMGEGSSSESDDDERDDDAGEQAAVCRSDKSDTSHGGSEANEEEARHPVSSTPAAAAASPDGHWGTDRIRRVLREYTYHFMGAALGTRSWRHAYHAIHWELASDSKTRDVVDMLYWGKVLITNDAQALQSGQTVQTEESGYGRLLIESPHQTSREREQFRGVSVDWHRLLGFASAWTGSHTPPSQTASMMARQEQRASSRWAALPTADLKAEFRALVNNSATEFWSKQEEGLMAITQRRLRVLVVMATGVGKSLL